MAWFRYFFEVSKYNPPAQIPALEQIVRKIDDHWPSVGIPLSGIGEVGKRKTDILDELAVHFTKRHVKERNPGVYVVSDVRPAFISQDSPDAYAIKRLLPEYTEHQLAGKKVRVEDRIGWEWDGYDYGACLPNETGVVYRGSTLTLVGTDKSLVVEAE